MKKGGSKIDQEAVVRKALNGDQQAFRSLVEEYKNLVFAICLNAVGDPFEAENLAQETFLQVYKSLPNYKFRGFTTWISKIALNKCIDFKRRAASRKNRETICLSDLEHIADEGMSIQDMLIEKEERELLDKCLNKIPEHYATVLRKSYKENKTCKEIAEEENISVRAVETRLYRGRKILRERFEELNEYGDRI